jgi:hypothetical protein
MNQFLISIAVLVLVLVLAICRVVEIDVRIAAVAANKALANAILTSTNIVKEGCWIVCHVTFAPPTHFEGIVIAATLIIVDRDGSGKIVPSTGFLSHGNPAPSSRLANLEVTNGVVGKRTAARAAFVVATTALQRADEDSIASHTQFSLVIDPDPNVASAFPGARIPSGLLPNPELDLALPKAGG